MDSPVCLRIDVLGLCLAQFNSLYASLRRNQARILIRDAYVSHYAAQAGTDDLTKFLKPWKELTEIEENDEKAFLSRFKAGF